MTENDRTSISVEGLKRALADNLFCVRGRFGSISTPQDRYQAVAYTVRDRLLRRWLNTIETYLKGDARIVAYLSAEYLLGPQLENNLLNLGFRDQMAEAVKECGFELDDLIAQEPEPGLGNGGLGRLAACYLDSLATLDIPSAGYGIRYQFGIFDQEIRNGWQTEVTDDWLRFGNPWEIARPEAAINISLGGRTEPFEEGGRYRVRWVPAKVVQAVPYDTAIPGYKTNTAITLRLWSAEAPHSLDFQAFNSGDYFGAAAAAVDAETITKILYPNDQSEQGQELRLKQQFFFVSASLQDIIRLHTARGHQIERLHEKFAMQMNDTHPSIAIAELMRLLIDEHNLDWEPAWQITRGAFGYTNHTLLPEALERWPLPMFGRLLPRHLEIIYEINARFLAEVRTKFPGDEDRPRRMSIIDESGQRFVRMAHLATVGSHAVNGVAELHSELLKTDVLRDFYEFSPAIFTNVTNGVTPRRWIALSNPGLTTLISSAIGSGWIKDLNALQELEKFAGDAAFRRKWRDVKRNNKLRLAEAIHGIAGLQTDPETMFDVQVKRLHEYKRQHLNILFLVTLYNRIRRTPDMDIVPRTIVFGGKAAPGYFMAKLIIKLINSVASVVNGDSQVRGRLKTVFLPNFEVGLGQRVYPAADLSEQLSTAGKEASGTGNMKFALNGALTIGTLDGANVEIRQEVGPENFFLFGLTTDEVRQLRPAYRPRDYYESNADLREAVDLIASGHFSDGDFNVFRPLVDSLLNRDPYMLLADYQSYVDCQDGVSAAFRDEERWTRMSILNVARMAKFSSDRSVRDYCEKIWRAVPVPIRLTDYVQQNTNLRERSQHEDIVV